MTATPTTVTGTYEACTELSTHSFQPNQPSARSVSPPPAQPVVTPMQNSESGFPSIQSVVTMGPPTPTTIPRQPTHASRQRTSNIAVNNAELEFNKTALSACRSTISQQEIELRRLKENIEIRNKRIIQLEAQVSHATDFIASRDSSKDSKEDRLGAIAEKVERLAESVTSLKTFNPAHNIVINPCVTNPNPTCHICKKVSVSTQTPSLPCDPPCTTEKPPETVTSALSPHPGSPVQCIDGEAHHAQPSSSL